MVNPGQTFYIFRHGLATHSTVGYGNEILSAQLLPEGYPAIEKLAEYLKNIHTDAFFSSEILRCKQTAEIIAQKTGKQFVADSRLNEFYTESFEDFCKRVQSFVDKVTTMPANSVAICTHGAVLAAMKHLILEGEFLQRDELDFPPPSGMVVIKDGKAETIRFE
jgi:broad specificity phosphatase PhoE